MYVSRSIAPNCDLDFEISNSSIVISRDAVDADGPAKDSNEAAEKAAIEAAKAAENAGRQINVGLCNG